MARQRPAEHAMTEVMIETVRVLLAEDMDLLRTALVSLLSDEEDLEVVADLACDRDVVPAALRSRPDVAVVATDRPDTRGLYVVAELRRQLPECRVVALTVTHPPGLLRRLLAAGVHGLIGKNAPADRLLATIRDVARGGTMIDAGLVIAALDADPSPFTPREAHVLQLAAGGASGPEIARRLSLAPGTVRNYLSNAMVKTGARNRIDAIRIATESGWL
jgi:two-component system, NarL family, response regulator DesR